MHGDPLWELGRTLTDLGPRWRHPVYAQVRYETPEVVEALRALEFQPAFTMARLVRWIAVPLRELAEEEMEAGVSASFAFYFHLGCTLAEYTESPGAWIARGCRYRQSA